MPGERPAAGTGVIDLLVADVRIHAGERFEPLELRRVLALGRGERGRANVRKAALRYCSRCVHHGRQLGTRMFCDFVRQWFS